MERWRDLPLMRKTRKLAEYTCSECGSEENTQAHHYNGKDNSCLVVLCGKCHAKKHGDVPYGLFLNKQVHERQLWLDKYFFNDAIIRQGSKTWFVFGDIIVHTKTRTFTIADGKCKRCGTVAHKDGRRLKHINGCEVRRQAYLCPNCFYQWVEK